MYENDYKIEKSPTTVENAPSVINASDTDSLFGIGVVTGNRELECEHLLCVTLCSTTCTCSSSSGSVGGELNQVKKVS